MSIMIRRLIISLLIPLVWKWWRERRSERVQPTPAAP